MKLLIDGASPPSPMISGWPGRADACPWGGGYTRRGPDSGVASASGNGDALRRAIAAPGWLFRVSFAPGICGCPYAAAWMP